MTTTVLHPLPLTLAERELAPDILRVKVSFEEYLDLAEQCEYTIEYVNGEIISMSQASLPHETLVGRLLTVLNLLYDDDNSVNVYSSNIKIFIEATGDSVNADFSVVQGQPDYLVLPGGTISTATVKNPVLLIEVLSQSTLAFDLGDKLEIYKQIPGLKQVLFVSQHKPWVISYIRTETPGLWLNTSAHTLNESISILENQVALSAIYKKFAFA